MISITRSENLLEIQMSAELSNIDRACLETRASLREQGLEDCSFEVQLVMREALSNAIIHGSGMDKKKTVDYAFEIRDDTLIMRVRDQGAGFPWHEKSANMPAPHSLGGRGVTIMREYFDSVEFNEQGNAIVLTKHYQKGACMSEIQQTGDTIIVKPGQDIVSSMADDFKTELKGLVDKGAKEITMDMEKVEMIDSIGMGLLIAAHNSLVKNGGRLRIINCSTDILGLLRTMRLDKHFEVVA